MCSFQCGLAYALRTGRLSFLLGLRLEALSFHYVDRCLTHSGRADCGRPRERTQINDGVRTRVVPHPRTNLHRFRCPIRGNFMKNREGSRASRGRHDVSLFLKKGAGCQTVIPPGSEFCASHTHTSGNNSRKRLGEVL